ncbi:excinuclease ABC subunit UvrA [Aquabacterium olei]|uniref:excinuclease ABC subunit UvrA n=1 Tax=Aquabacterium olei TaxID=1296669 RepID=UPI001FEC4F06|nr:excinuclease ABC subunit UvrA [Aquabacterium olei]
MSDIRIRGARQHNLKNLDLDIRTGELTVVTGPSGSGKSSLVFDTLYAEGQRRYVETFSAYARQFLDRMDRPAVDRVDGVPPAIAIDQTNPVRTSRSTVGTMTELNDHLKLLFARGAQLFDQDTGQLVREDTPQSVFDELLRRCSASEGGRRVVVTFAAELPANTSTEQMEEWLSASGFSRVQAQRVVKVSSLPSAALAAGQARAAAALDDADAPKKKPAAKKAAAKKATKGDAADVPAADERLVLDVVVDRFRIGADPSGTDLDRPRVMEALEVAFKRGSGHITVYALTDDEPELWRFSAGLHCPDSHRRYSTPQPGMFSFNSAAGACPTCRGFGRVIGVDWGLVIPDAKKTLRGGAIKPLQTPAWAECQNDLIKYAGDAGVPRDTAWSQMSAEQKHWVLEGDPDWKGNWNKQWYGIRRFFEYLESKAYKMHIRVLLSKYRSYTPCPTCDGARLQLESLLWRLGSKADADAVLLPGKRFSPKGLPLPREAFEALPGLNLHDLMLLPIDQLQRFFSFVTLANRGDNEALALLLDEIRTRLKYLVDVGLGYLTLDRQSRTLSGGEVQRINLTTALGTSLVNTLFVLDEPSIGLHPRDMDRINLAMQRLVDAGNTLVVVEHDPAVMLAADRVIDLGPGPGHQGGRIVFDGSPDELKRAETLTGAYLGARRTIGIGKRRPVEENTPRLILQGAREHNLKNLNVDFPLQRLVGVTGVSGSGKSSLIQDILHPALLRHFGLATESPGEHDDLLGADWLSGVSFVDQSPIGKTARSNPASYVGAFDAVRTLFATTPLSRERKYTAGTFSFNAGNGRCPTCGGSGFEHVEMQFLSDVYLRCPDCDGTRFRAEVREVQIERLNKKLSISDVLELTVAEAVRLFAQDVDVVRALQPLADVGLDYVKLGQPVPTLSGGEAQRLKLAGHLVEAAAQMSKSGQRTARKGTLFLFDEPTTGLHFDDIAKLMRAFGKLLDAGNSIILIEHNLDVIRACDWLIELGPEGGDAGGQIVATGAPETLKLGRTHTAVALREYEQALGLKDGTGSVDEPVEDATPAKAKGRSKPAPASEAAQAVPSPNRVMVPAANDSTALLAAEATPTYALAASDDGVSLQALIKARREQRRAAAAKAPGHDAIEVVNAHEHNLKGLSVHIPRGKFNVVTGVSGSGKSTLAFDILFNEGQRRYLESLNAYARSLVQPAGRPEVDAVYGIPPTVAIEQRLSRGGRKSTVGTTTEVHHFLRLLYVKLGVQHCPCCVDANGHPIPVLPQTPEAIAAQWVRDHRGQHIGLMAPLVVNRKGIYTELAKWAAGKGFTHLRVDGEFLPVAGWGTAKGPKIDRYREHTIELPVGDVVVTPENEGRLRELLASALEHGKGVVHLITGLDGLADALATGKSTLHMGRVKVFSTQRACPSCGTSFPELDPRLFSYNSKHGWCPDCVGTGLALTREQRLALDDSQQDDNRGREQTFAEPEVEDVEDVECGTCHGARLNAVARAVQLRGDSIADVSALAVKDARKWAEKLKLDGREATIARDIVSEIKSRLAFMEQVGLGYLSLDRAAPTLSGGEAQRIRLAAQLGSNLQGVCYVLDEPTIGLHPRDNQLLLDALHTLGKEGNTLVVVEHDEDTIRRAEHVIDIGPGAGVRGGTVVAQGTVADIMASADSVTGRCLRSPMVHPLRRDEAGEPLPRRTIAADTPLLTVKKARLHNLDHVTVEVPLHRLVAVTGVSGSGKSTLARDVLLANVQAAVAIPPKARATTRPTWHGCEGIDGWGLVDRVLEVDQTPIGKTPRSCPATYIGFWDTIRKLFADTLEARARGWGPGRFSFNTGEGRCPDCEGQGIRTIEMAFLPDVKVHCDTCNGMRFNPETLAATWRGKHIGDVLKMEVDEAVAFFASMPSIAHPLKLLQDVGLGYLTLGQPSPTLSGGEAQRIKLVTELSKVRDDITRRGQKAPHTLYVLDEPTVGLHMADVERLIKVLHRLVDGGHSVVVIEHDLDVIAEADWIVDMGPEGGSGGGKVAALGTPDQVVASRSHTGVALKGVLQR